MKRLIIPAAVILIASFSFWWFSPTQVLKRRTSAFIETANVPAGMGDLGRGARGRHLAGYLAPQIEVDSPQDLAAEVGRRFSRDRASELYSVVARYCRQISINDLAFDSVTVVDDAAEVLFTADAIVELPGRRPVDGLVVVESRWRKIDGEWRLEAFQWSESPRP